MSDNLNDEKTKEAIDKIKQEYARLCGRYGNCRYQISVLQRDAEMLEKELDALNLEAVKASVAEVK